MVSTIISTRSPRGPITSLRSILRSSRRFFEELSSYGDVVEFHLLTKSCLYINHPGLIKRVMTAGYSWFDRDQSKTGVFRQTLGDNLVTLDGKPWHDRRRAINPCFDKQSVAVYNTMIIDETTNMLRHWHNPELATSQQEPLNVMEEMLNITLQLAGRAFFGMDARSEHLEDAITALERYQMEQFYAPFLFPLSWPLPHLKAVRQGLHPLHACIDHLIAVHRQRPEDYHDLLSNLLTFHLTDRQLRDEVLNTIMAGHETTASALAWTVYTIATHPEVEDTLDTLKEELVGVLGDRQPTAVDIEHLPYLEAVIRETLRLYPPIWSLARRAVQDDRYNNYLIRRGTTIFIVPLITQRDPRYFEDPEQFNPQRFMTRPTSGEWVYMPFGAGQHACIGGHFAWLEMKLILALLLQHQILHGFRLALGEGRVIPGAFPALRPLTVLPDGQKIPGLLMERRLETALR